MSLNKHVCYVMLCYVKLPPVCLEHGFENSLVDDRLMTGRTAKFHLLLISLIIIPHCLIKWSKSHNLSMIRVNYYVRLNGDLESRLRQTEDIHLYGYPMNRFCLNVVHYSLYLPGNR